MTVRISVGISEFRLARPPEVLITYGLGSCLAVALHEPTLQLGGLAHTLLPEARAIPGHDRPGKFVDAAIRLMLEQMLARGGRREHLQAKIFGGANMFEPLLGGAGGSVGSRNAQRARAVLAELEIPLAAADVGGSFGRTVEFDPASGAVLVRAVRGREGEFRF